MLLALAIGLVGGLQLFYSHIYWIHPDLGGGILSGRLSTTLGNSFENYSLYFPPAERAWFSFIVWVSGIIGLRIDLTAIFLTSVAVLFSAGLAYHVRRNTLGASPLFLAISLVVLVALPIAFLNVFGLRAHIVVLGLWPYLVLRISDPDGTKIGWKTRLLVGLWLGATLLLKYLYSLIVLLVEIADAALQRQPFILFRIENVVSGAIVAAYILSWLVLDPDQREAIGVIVNAIDANLTDSVTNLQQAAISMALAVFFVLIGFVFKVPARPTVIGLAVVSGAVAAAWIQSRWYSHHLFPVTCAYAVWLWFIHRDVKAIWLFAIALVLLRPVIGEYLSTAPYQKGVTELDKAMNTAGLSVEGKRVGVLIMNPSPVNQYLAVHGAWRWNASVNNSYVAAELKPFDTPDNLGLKPPPLTLEEPGRRMLHDEFLRLWEDMPPDALILDQTTSWPLRNVVVDWTHVFSEDPRFNALFSQYRLVLEHDGEHVRFRYFERRE
ncbi:hypothetical protein [Erythrobacter ani]|uniref:Glycosyltransferase RgtA/B/C/D-like domain-containing protein n=1 Tax=Erythrobacter ani TaxID=2827235 RepID=A0ABS6SIH2_9SPHN|nr:hypothetical protein [Erythrobacter ani]MBV7264809.1 hypothetical protein [Erythrobacter ani]